MKLYSLLVAGGGIVLALSTQAQPTGNPNTAANSQPPVFSYWTKERRAQVQPRDLVVDERGLGYLRGRNGNLRPYGHDVAAAAGQKPRGKPSSVGDDSSPPTVSEMTPADTTIGSSATFSARVEDPSGIKSVSFVLTTEGGISQNFTPTRSGSVYQVGLQGFTNGNWNWTVVARDNASKGGNSMESDAASFVVDVGSGGSGGSGGTSGGDDAVANAPWTNGGYIQQAAGRIYFEMPDIQRRGRNSIITGWSG